jgi:hypothetical protein
MRTAFINGFKPFQTLCLHRCDIICLLVLKE